MPGVVQRRSKVRPVVLVAVAVRAVEAGAPRAAQLAGGGGGSVGRGGGLARLRPRVSVHHRGRVAALSGHRASSSTVHRAGRLLAGSPVLVWSLAPLHAVAATSSLAGRWAAPPGPGREPAGMAGGRCWRWREAISARVQSTTGGGGSQGPNHKMLWLLGQSHRYIWFRAWAGRVHAPPTFGGWLPTFGRRLSTGRGAVVHGGGAGCPRDDSERVFDLFLPPAYLARYSHPDWAARSRARPSAVARSRVRAVSPATPTVNEWRDARRVHCRPRGRPTRPTYAAEPARHTASIWPGIPTRTGRRGRERGGTRLPAPARGRSRQPLRR